MVKFFEKHKNVLFIIALAFICWGGLLSLRGIWWDDWAWVWQYFGTPSLHEFLIPFKNLHKQLEGILMYLFFKQFEVLHFNATLAWNIIKFVIFLLSSLVLYRIVKAVDKNNSKLPEIIAGLYIVSPIVNNLCLVILPYHIELFSFLVSVLFTLKSLQKDRFSKWYYISSILLAAYSMISLNSYVFFEVIRATLIFYSLSNIYAFKKPEAFKKTIILWAPFLIIGTGVMLYFATHPQTGSYAGTYKMQAMSIAHLKGIFDRYVITGQYLFNIYFYYALHNFIHVVHAVLKSYLLLLTVSIAVVAALFYGKCGDLSKEKSNTFLKYSIFGIFTSIVGYFPYALVRDAAWLGITSRHAILANLGVAITVGSVICALYYRNKLTRIFSYLMFSVFILLGVLECRIVQDAYAQDWHQQQQFWVKFVSTIPDIKENTFLIVDMPKIEEIYLGHWRGSYEFSAPLNLLYAKSRSIGEVNKNFAEWFNIITWRELPEKKADERDSFKGAQKFYPFNILFVSYWNDVFAINKSADSPYQKIKPVFVKEILSRRTNNRIINTSKNDHFPLRWIIGYESPKK